MPYITVYYLPHSPTFITPTLYLLLAVMYLHVHPFLHVSTCTPLSSSVCIYMYTPFLLRMCLTASYIFLMHPHVRPMTPHAPSCAPYDSSCTLVCAPCFLMQPPHVPSSCTLCTPKALRAAAAAAEPLLEEAAPSHQARSTQLQAPLGWGSPCRNSTCHATMTCYSSTLSVPLKCPHPTPSAPAPRALPGSSGRGCYLPGLGHEWRWGHRQGGMGGSAAQVCCPAHHSIGM